MANVGSSNIRITADDRQARRTVSDFVRTMENGSRNIDRAFNNLDPFERLENGARQAERTIGRSIRNLPEHLEGFHGSLNTTRGYLRDLGRNGSQSIDELADAAIRARVGVERIGSASGSARDAIRVVQGLTDETREAQLAVLGLNEEGTIRLDADEANRVLLRYRGNVASTIDELERFRDAGDMGSYVAGMEVVERQLADVDRALRAASRGGSAYTAMIDELGINTQWRANQAAVAMEAYKNRFLRAIDLMNARKTQSQGLIDLLPETSNIQAVDEAFLSVGDALERMAKRGTAANLAISMLGRNASMYDLRRMIRTINQGLIRMQMVATYVGIGFAAMTAALFLAAKGPSMADVLQKQADAWGEYADAVQKRTDEIMNTWSIFEEVQLETFDPNKLMRNLSEQVNIMKNWQKNLSDLAKRGVDSTFVQYLREMGPEAAGEIAALTEMSRPELDKYVALWNEKMKLSRSAAELELTKLREATERKVKALQESLTPLGIALYGMFNEWATVFTPFVESWGKVAAKVIDAVTAIGKFLNAINQANDDISKIVGWFIYLFSAITLILSPMAIGIGRANGMKAAFTATFMIIKPFVIGLLRIAGTATILSTAIIVVVGSLMKMWGASENLRNAVSNLWTSLVSGVKQAVAPLITDLKAMGTAFMQLLNVMIGSEGNSAKDFWKSFGDIVAVVVNGIAKVAIPLLVGSIETIVTAVRLVVQGATAAFTALQPVIAGVVTFIRGVIATLQGNQGKGASIFASLGLDPSTVREAIASLTAFRNGAITAFGAVKTAIQTLKTFVAGLFALFTGNTGKGASLLTSIGLSPGAVLAIMAAVNQIKSGFSAVFGFIKQVAPEVGRTVLMAFNLIRQIVTAVMPNITSIISVASGIIMKTLGFIWPIIVGTIQMAWNNIKNIVTSGIAIIQNVIQLFSNLLQGNWSAAWQNVKNIVMNLITFIWNYISLVFLGRVLGIFRAFAASGMVLIRAGLTGIKTLFLSGITAVRTYVATGFSAIASKISMTMLAIVTGTLAAWNNIKSGIVTIVTSLGTAIATGFNFVVTAIATFLLNAYTTVVNGWNIIKTAFVTAVSAIVAAVAYGFLSLITAIVNTMTSIQTGIVTAWNFITTFIANVLISLVSAVVVGFNNTLIAIRSAMTAVQTAISTAWTFIVSLVTSIVLQLVAAVQSGFSALVNGAINLFNTLVSTTISLWNSLRSGVSSAASAILSAVVSAFNSLVSSAVSIISSMVSSIVSLWNNLRSGVSSAASSILSAVVSAFNSLVSSAVSLISSMVSSIVSFFSNLRSNISSAISNIRSAITNGFNSAVSAATSAMSNLVSAVRNGASNAVSRVQDMGRNIISTIRNIDLYNVGRDIISGLINGIGSMVGAVAQKARDLAGNVISSMKNALKSKSPSKLTIDIGGDVGTGLLMGLDNMVRSVGKKSVELAKAATPEIDTKNMVQKAGSLLDVARAKGNEMLMNVNGAGGDTHNHYWNVNADEISEVQKVVNMVNGLNQSANKGVY